MKNLHLMLLFIGLNSFSTNVPVFASGTCSHAQTNEEVEYTGPLTIKLGARVDYQREYQKSDFLGENSGFKGNNVMISIQGNLNNHFSYRFRQRLHQLKHTENFFDGTDFMYLNYALNNKFDITAGKNAIELGSAEYQRNPSDQYIFSEFYYYMPFYKFAVNLGYNVTTNDRLVLQASESPFRTKETDFMAYSFSWYGNHGCYQPIYSFNAYEYRRGKFMYGLSTGHQFIFDKFRIHVDYMQRIAEKQNIFDDFSVRGELMVQANDYFNIKGICAYDKNVCHDFGPLYMVKGTEITRLGGVLEYTPLPEQYKTLRVHASYSYTFGQRGFEGQVPDMNRHLMVVGVQWEMDIVDLAKKIINKI